MKNSELMRELEYILEVPQGTLRLDQSLVSYAGWSSMAQISLIALFDKHLHKTLDYADLEDLETVQDIIELACAEDVGLALA